MASAPASRRDSGRGRWPGRSSSLLALAIHFFKLRRVFIALKKDLLDILTFDQHIGVAVCFCDPDPRRALIGLLGAAFCSMPPKLRRPLVIGLTWAFFTGLFQELIQLMLQYEFLMKVREVFFTWDGLRLQGAFIVFGLATVASAIWQACRPRYDAFRENATPGQAKMLLGFKILVGLILIIGFPAFAGNFIGQVLMLVGLYVLMGMGLNLELGLAGLLDLGFGRVLRGRRLHHRAAHLERRHRDRQHELLAGAADRGGAVGDRRGAVRDPGAQGAGATIWRVATLGLGEIVRVLVLSDFAAPVLGGAQGVLGIPRRPSAASSSTTRSTSSTSPSRPRRWPRTSPGGSRTRVWAVPGPRSGTTRTWRRPLGINLVNVKLLAYGLGAGFAGVAGSIFAVMLASIFPHSFQLLISINVLALLIVGGMGSLPGVVVGAAALIGLPELLREFGEYRFLFYGLVIVVMMRIKAEGPVGRPRPGAASGCWRRRARPPSRRSFAARARDGERGGDGRAHPRLRSAHQALRRAGGGRSPRSLGVRGAPSTA